MSLQYAVYENHSQTTQARLVSWQDLLSLIKSPVDFTGEPLDDRGGVKPAKDKAQCLIPSDLTTGKTKRLLNYHNNYTLLVIDIDSGNRSITEISDTLKGYEIELFSIYTTASATPTDRRWRILIPISKAMDTLDWIALQGYLVHVMEGDSCMSRPTQISYLPILTKLNQDCYEYAVETGKPVDPLNSTLALQAFKYEDEQDELRTKELAQKEKTAKAKPVQVSGDSISPIDAFNSQCEWETLLLNYGYIKGRGARWLHPNSSSGSAGVIISYRDDLQGRYISSHGCDSLNDGHSHDKFDLFKELEHNGDLTEALKGAGSMLRVDTGQTITEHNRGEYMKNKEPKKDIVIEENDLFSIWENAHYTDKPILLTGFHDLDTLAPIVTGDYLIIAGRTSEGKTSFATQILLYMAKMENRVLHFCLDEASSMTLEKLMCQVNGRYGELYRDKNNQDDAREACDKLSKLPFKIADDNILNIESIVEYATAYKEKYPDLKVISVDYIQTVGCKSINSYERVSHINRELFALTKKLGVTVIALAQFNREAEDNSKAPTLANLKNSGDLEQDATKVFGLYAPDRAEGALAWPVTLKIMKNKMGQRGKTVNFNFNGPSYTFERKADNNA